MPTKSFILSFLLTCVTASASPTREQALTLNQTTDNLEKLLYTVWFDPALPDATIAKVTSNFPQILTSTGLELRQVDDTLKALADIRVVPSGQTWQIVTAAQTCPTTPQSLTDDLASAARQDFGQGSPPSYSTVFESGKDGYVEYRIPSILSLPEGRVIAFSEGRNAHRDIAENDIVCRISDDGGKFWSPLQVISEEGASSLNNPCAVYLPEKKRILLMFQSYPPKTGEGHKLRDTMRVCVVHSDDAGKTWSKPRDVASQVFHPDANTICSGPGAAIQLAAGPHKGRIIVPFNALGGPRKWFNYLVYSDDLGESWKIAPGTSQYGGNESQVVQSGPSELLVSTRCHRTLDDNSDLPPSSWSPWAFAANSRARGFIRITFAGDNFQWSPIEVRQDLPDPLCQGSITRYSGLGVGQSPQSIILLANPASHFTLANSPKGFAATPPIRMNGTARVSLDEGKSWIHSKRLVGAPTTAFQYSVLTSLPSGKIGCIFESSPKILFTSFDLDWLTSGKIKSPSAKSR